LLLPIIGIVFVGEAASSGLQKFYYKYTRWRTGTPVRLFRMAPLHHHFELGGWSETQITQRFVMITMVATFLGVSLALTFHKEAQTANLPINQPPAVVAPER
jgi:phospho-N-acetylmuramoyl-pentapeptide-transferase